MEGKFPVGNLYITPGAQGKLTPTDVRDSLRRHISGDWGDLDAHDKLENEVSLERGWRILSAYKAANGTKFWIITEADRSSTTILLPSEY